MDAPYYYPTLPTAEQGTEEPACCVCGRPADADFVGFQIQPITFFRGEKSGRMVSESDLFPNGKDRLYVCFDCTSDDLLECLSFGART